ncbi:PLD nuclease N-terminal domain-containing protein [Cellulosimicrobium marinum]|uniref:PLD nuclease N-terminal domain-containing protein n=1 Tax=Cellulosimicrobium marinum TaxID=1638992 RepID=UPI001E2F04AB|nr:PLD nuclease N-terminal domain-containing protein [Cellulosimicrobium marinum]MCB7138189.1 PLD nuclease N-terminal domain-containing protein [Cellulosimicrobium marinum]
MARVLVVLLAVGLAVYALADLSSSDEEDRNGIPKGLWIVLVVLLPFVGPIAWILVKRSQRNTPRYGTSGRPAGGATRRRRSGPVAPDDDPEFLWRLEQDQRRQARGASQDGPADPADPTGTPDGGTGTASSDDAGDQDADGSTDPETGPNAGKNGGSGR